MDVWVDIAENISENIAENVTENHSLDATSNATKTGTVLGLDSWKDFEVCFKQESGEFKCYKGSAVNLLSWRATIIGRGNTTVKVALKDSLVPHFLLHIGNTSEVYEFSETPTPESYDLGIEGATPPVINLQAPNNNTNQSTNSVEFIFNATDETSDMDSCSLWLDESTGYTKNQTRSGTVVHNKSTSASMNTNCTLNLWFERNATDMSGSGNDGTIASGVTNTTGIVGYAYEFDGDEDYIKRGVSDFGSSDQQGTISAWVKMASDAYSQGIFTSSDEATDNYYLNINIMGGYLTTFVVEGGSVLAFIVSYTTLLETNTWHHVAVVSDGTEYQFFVDGQKGVLTTLAGSNGGSWFGDVTNRDNFLIGAWERTDISYDFNGTIDEVLIFNRSLSSGEISAINNDSANKLNFEGYNTSFDLVTFDDANIDWKVECNDTLDNNANSSIRDLTVDTTAPTVESQAPINWYNSSTSSVNFTFNATDTTSDLKNCTLLLLKSGSWEYNTSNTMLAEGINNTFNLTIQDISLNWTVMCEDSAGNLANSSNWNLTVDTTGPVVNLQAPENKSREYTQYINFTYNATNGLFGIDMCRLYLGTDSTLENNINETDASITETVNQTFNLTFTENLTHTYYWKVECNDTWNHYGNSSIFTFDRDALVTMSKPNIGSMAYYDPNYVVGMWSFERVEGTNVVDETGLNNGTLGGNVKWVPDEIPTKGYPLQNTSGRIGKAFYFDGDNDYISVPYSNFATISEGTISAWIKIKKFPGMASAIKIFGVQDGDDVLSIADLDILNLGASYLTWTVASDGTTHIMAYGGTALNLNEWYYVAVAVDNSGHRLYLNGKEESLLYINGDATSTHFFDDVNDIDSAVIGAGKMSGSYSRYFSGTIDEVVIWNRSLSANEVKQLYYSSADSYNSTYTVQDIAAAPNNTADADNDTIKYIYNWYKDNTSIAVLNMPFEAVNNGSEQNFSKDYSGFGNDMATTHFNSSVLECGATVCSGWNRTGGYDGKGAYHFDGNDDYIKKSVAGWQSSDSQGTITAWIKLVSGAGANTIFSSADEGTNTKKLLLREGDNTKLEVLQRNADTADRVVSTNAIVLNEWTHVAVVSDGSSYTLYLNGKAETPIISGGSNSGDWFAETDDRDNFAIGILADSGMGDFFDGTIDEVQIYDRALSSAQVLALYRNQTHLIKRDETNPREWWHAQVVANDGYGDSTPENTTTLQIQTITLNINNQAPINYYNSSTSSVNFTYNYTNYENISGVDNCSLWLYKDSSWERNKTKYWPVEEINNTFNITIQDISLNWTIACYDIESEQTNSSSLNLTVDTTAPIVNLQAPINNTNTTNHNVSFIYNVTDNLLPIDSCILWLYKSNAWELNYTDSSITETINQSINITMEDFNNNWKVECNDTLNNRGNSTTNNLKVYTPTVPTAGPSHGGINLETPEPRADYRIIPEKTTKVIMKEGDIKSIILDNKNVLNIKLVRVEENVAILSINNVIIFLALNDVQQIDLDNDKFFDLEIMLDGVDNYNKVVSLVVKRIFTVKKKGIIQKAIMLKEYGLGKARNIEKIAEATIQKAIMLKEYGLEKARSVIEGHIDWKKFFGREKLIKFKSLLFAVIPLIIIGLTILSLFYYPIQSIRRYKVTFITMYSYVFLLALGLISLMYPLTIESLYWIIFPFSMMILFIFIILMLISHYTTIMKAIKSYKKITLTAILLGLGVIILITPFTNEVLYGVILPLSAIFISLLLIFLLIYYGHVITNVFKLLVKVKLKTYIILLFMISVACLILFINFGSITGYTTIPSSVKDSFGFGIATILVILGIGVYYLKRLRSRKKTLKN